MRKDPLASASAGGSATHCSRAVGTIGCVAVAAWAPRAADPRSRPGTSLAVAQTACDARPPVKDRRKRRAGPPYNGGHGELISYSHAAQSVAVPTTKAASFPPCSDGWQRRPLARE